RKEIYAMACVAGGLAYWGLSYLGVSLYITVIVAFCVVCAIRLLAVRYHISLPKLRDEEQTVE
ncbi:trimeric intracellular cation channel family protein, partial [Prevotella copri]|nr:trimeric intracellular cation channel family protein [Segatella copri]